MRSFQEEVNPDGKRRGTDDESSAVPAAQTVDNNAFFRGLVGVAAVVAIVVGLLLVANTAGSYAGPAGSKRPKAVVVVAPGWNPLVVESAMASNKAASLSGLVSSGAAYSRIASNASDPTAALVSLFTGTTTSFHNVTNSSLLGSFQQSDATSFMRYITEASLKSTIVASAEYFSGAAYNSNGQCAFVGPLDAECVGNACPADSTVYCNGATREILNNDITALMGTIISDAFSAAAPGNSLITVVVNAFSAIRGDDDNSLRALSATALMDGVVGQLVLAAQQRSFLADENWLVTVVGDGANPAQQAPLFVIPIASGSVIRARPIGSATANIVDVFTTIAKWFNLPVPVTAVGRVQGICGEGRVVTTC